MRYQTHYLSLLASVSAATLLAACGGGGGGGSDGGSTGTLAVSMTDAPACGYDEVNVTVKQVRVHKSSSAEESDGGWTDITLSEPRKINLLELTNGVLENLGETALAEGNYTQLRLVLDANTSATSMANSIVLTADPEKTPVHLVTPSAVQSGIKLIRPFEVKAGQRVDLVLDFDACKSIVRAGNDQRTGKTKYLLKPVVEVIPTALNGIDGYIDPALLTRNISISAQQNGVVVRSTVPKSSGEFFLARLEPGNYDVVITADNHAVAVVAAVPVATDATVRLSNTATPIKMSVAATAERSIGGKVTLDPSSETIVPYVAAQQAFAAGPKVTVKYMGADVSDGTYTIANLPTVAPELARYTTALPLTFSAQTDTTPGTGKYSVIASATGYPSSVPSTADISAANQSAVNFTLK